MRSSPRETGLWLWCPLSTGNKNVPRKAIWTEWLNGHPGVWRAGNGSCNLQGPTNTVPTVDLGQWCRNSRELQVIHPEKPDQRHKSGPSQYIHTPRHSIHQGELGLLEQLQDELKDTTVMCGDFNARWSMLDKQPWATSSSTQSQLRYQQALDGDKGTRTAPLTWVWSHQE